MRRYVEKEPLVAARVILSERPDAISVGLSEACTAMRLLIGCAVCAADRMRVAIALGVPRSCATAGHYLQRLILSALGGTSRCSCTRRH